MVNPLKAALDRSGAKVAGAAPTPPEPATKSPAAPTSPAPSTGTARQPSREGTAAITVHYPEPVRRQLKVLASEDGRTMDDMVAEALNLLFARYRKGEIAPRKASK